MNAKNKRPGILLVLLEDLSFSGALVVLAGVFLFFLMICKVSIFDRKLKEMEADFKAKYNMIALKAEARNEFEKFKTEKESLLVEDMEDHHKKKHKRKHRNRVEPVTELPPTDNKEHDDDQSDDDRIVNIKNSVVYITSNPPTPTHEK